LAFNPVLIATWLLGADNTSKRSSNIPAAATATGPQRKVLVANNSASMQRINALERTPFAAIHQAACPPQFAFLFKPHDDLISFD
jgi:hypothetical protein